MELYEKNLKRNISIIISILLHLLIFSFLFYRLGKELKKIKEFKDEVKDISSYIPIYTLPETSPNTNTEEQPEENIKEEIIPEIPDTIEEIVEEIMETQPQLAIQENVIKEETIKETKKPKIRRKKPFIRRSILQTSQEKPMIPNIKEYVQQQIKNEIFQTLNENPANDFRHASYQQKIMKMISDSFIALYSGKHMGVPQHEYDIMLRGVNIEIRISISENGSLDLVSVISPATEYNKCLEAAIKHAAPFPRIPKHFNLTTYNIQTRINTALNLYGGGIMTVYPK